MHALVLDRKPLSDAAHRRFVSVELTQVANLAAALAIRHRNGIARLCHIDPDEN